MTVRRGPTTAQRTDLEIPRNAEVLMNVRIMYLTDLINLRN